MVIDKEIMTSKKKTEFYVVSNRIGTYSDTVPLRLLRSNLFTDIGRLSFAFVGFHEVVR